MTEETEKPEQEESEPEEKVEVVDEDRSAKEWIEDVLDEDKGEDEKVPEWIVWPDDLNPPPPTATVAYFRFPKATTRLPEDHHCIIWPLTVEEERIANKRGRGDGQRVLEEMAIASIRAVDGQRVNWMGTKGGMNRDAVYKFWRDIGPKFRRLLTSYFHRTHAFDGQELADFFGQHFAVGYAHKSGR